MEHEHSTLNKGTKIKGIPLTDEKLRYLRRSTLLKLAPGQKPLNAWKK